VKNLRGHQEIRSGVGIATLNQLGPGLHGESSPESLSTTIHVSKRMSRRPDPRNAR
jgi:hypothetical protein